MKILLLNKYHYIVGGTERYYFDLEKLLVKHGHTVAFFSMQHPKNEPTVWEQHFVSNILYKNIGFVKGLIIFFRMLYSTEAKQKISSLLDVFKPDVAHVHNIYHHISPSILFELKKRNIPVIYTLHDYHLLTPSIVFFHNGKICNLSQQDNILRLLFHKCVQDSFFATLATSLCLKIHTAFGMYTNNVDFFISPSAFMKQKHIDNGFNREKIIRLQNYVACRSLTSSQTKTGTYVLFMGDSLRNKGLSTVLQVAKHLPSVNFRVIVRKHDTWTQKTQKYLFPKNIRAVEFLSKLKLRILIRKSAFVLVPSLWYENQPYTILESFAMGKPVVASNIGGIPELVKHNETGLLFEPGDISGCVTAIRTLWTNPKLTETLGRNAQRFVLQNFNPEIHYTRLMKIYKKTIRLHQTNNQQQ